jgi:hypothetical protein
MTLGIAILIIISWIIQFILKDIGKNKNRDNNEIKILRCPKCGFKQEHTLQQICPKCGEKLTDEYVYRKKTTKHTNTKQEKIKKTSKKEKTKKNIYKNKQESIKTGKSKKNNIKKVLTCNSSKKNEIREEVINDFQLLYYEFIVKVIEEMNHGIYSHISWLPEQDDRFPNLHYLGIIQMKRGGAFVEANRAYIKLITEMGVLDTGILYSWFKTLASAVALNEAYIILMISIIIKILEVNNGGYISRVYDLREEGRKVPIEMPYPMTEIEQYKNFKSVIDKKDKNTWLYYLNILAGSPGKDSEIYKFQERNINYMWTKRNIINNKNIYKETNDLEVRLKKFLGY